MKTKKKAPVSSAPTKHRKQKQIISKSTITREYNEYVKKENKVPIEIRRKYKNTEYLEED